MEIPNSSIFDKYDSVLLSLSLGMLAVSQALTSLMNDSI